MTACPVRGPSNTVGAVIAAIIAAAAAFRENSDTEEAS